MKIGNRNLLVALAVFAGFHHAAAQTWWDTGAPNAVQWQAVACLADGTKLVAAGGHTIERQGQLGPDVAEDCLLLPVKLLVNLPPEVLFQVCRANPQTTHAITACRQHRSSTLRWCESSWRSLAQNLNRDWRQGKIYVRPSFHWPAEDGFMGEQRNPLLGFGAILVASAHQFMSPVRPIYQPSMAEGDEDSGRVDDAIHFHPRSIGREIGHWLTKWKIHLQPRGLAKRMVRAGGRWG